MDSSQINAQIEKSMLTFLSNLASQEGNTEETLKYIDADINGLKEAFQSLDKVYDKTLVLNVTEKLRTKYKVLFDVEGYHSLLKNLIESIETSFGN